MTRTWTTEGHKCIDVDEEKDQHRSSPRSQVSYAGDSPIEKILNDEIKACTKKRR